MSKKTTFDEYCQQEAFPAHDDIPSITRLEYFTAQALSGVLAAGKYNDMPGWQESIGFKAISTARQTLRVLYKEYIENE